MFTITLSSEDGDEFGEGEFPFATEGEGEKRVSEFQSFRVSQRIRHGKNGLCVSHYRYKIEKDKRKLHLHPPLDIES